MSITKVNLSKAKEVLDVNQYKILCDMLKRGKGEVIIMQTNSDDTVMVAESLFAGSFVGTVTIPNEVLA